MAEQTDRGAQPGSLKHRALRDISELALVGLAFLLYFIVRANVVDRPEVALAHARHVVDLERTLGIFHEPAWQGWVLHYHALVRFFNFVYFWLDFPLITVLGLYLYARRRDAYTFTRDALLFSGAAALVCYYLYPVAPPRLAGIGVVDTLQAFNNLSYQAQSTSFFVNPYAAMPSLHVGWALLLAIGLWRAFPCNRLVLVFVIVHPLTQTASTVLTGNHFLLDGAAGVAAALIGLALATLMQRRGYPWLRHRFSLEPVSPGLH